jgi:hypothetical protein
MPTVAGWTPGGQSNTYYEPVRWPHAPTPGWGTVWANDQRFTTLPPHDEAQRRGSRSGQESLPTRPKPGAMS